MAENSSVRRRSAWSPTTPYSSFPFTPSIVFPDPKRFGTPAAHPNPNYGETLDEAFSSLCLGNNGNGYQNHHSSFDERIPHPPSPPFPFHHPCPSPYGGGDSSCDGVNMGQFLVMGDPSLSAVPLLNQENSDLMLQQYCQQLISQNNSLVGCNPVPYNYYNKPGNNGAGNASSSFSSSYSYYYPDDLINCNDNKSLVDTTPLGRGSLASFRWAPGCFGNYHHRQLQLPRHQNQFNGQFLLPNANHAYPIAFSNIDVSCRRQKLAIDPASFNITEDLRGQVALWARDQDKSKLLQTKLRSSSNKDDLDFVLSELIGIVPELMTDPFGNYLVQTLIEVCDDEQRNRILLSVIVDRLRFVFACRDNHGTRAVQKLLERLTTQQQISQFLEALAPEAVALAKHMNGHHVIQHCLKIFTTEQNTCILKQIADSCYIVATDKDGCCVVQQCVEYSQGEARDYLVSQIIECSLPLSLNRYGNYVVQFVLGKNHREYTSKIIEHLHGCYVQLSFDKFASNVVEKCLKGSDKRQAAFIVFELISSKDSSMLLLDPYGNYVIQVALEASEGGVHVALVGLIRKYVTSMRSNMYGKKVLSWFERNGIVIPCTKR